MAGAAYKRAGHLSGLATGPRRPRPDDGRPAELRPRHPRRPPRHGQDGARHQHRLQHRQGLARRAAAGRRDQDRRRRHRRLLLAGNVVGAARHPHPRRAGGRPLLRHPPRRHPRGPVRPDRRGGAGDAAHPALHRPDRRHLHRPARRARPPAEAPARPRFPDHRLSAAHPGHRAGAPRRTACRRSPRSPPT